MHARATKNALLYGGTDRLGELGEAGMASVCACSWRPRKTSRACSLGSLSVSGGAVHGRAPVYLGEVRLGRGPATRKATGAKPMCDLANKHNLTPALVHVLGHNRGHTRTGRRQHDKSPAVAGLFRWAVKESNLQPWD